MFTNISTQQYLDLSEALSGNHASDGCTVFFKDFIHKTMVNSKNICRAHDFGSRGLIDGVKPGINNNFQFLKANWDYGYRVWGVISFLSSLPYAVVRYNLGIKVGVVMFYAFMAAMFFATTLVVIN